MTTIAVGDGLGLSAATGAGGSPIADLGQGGGQVAINAANGNLVLQVQDEWLAGKGLDAAVVRTYNSQGLADDDNADNWRIGLYRSVVSLTGTVNTAGSTVIRVDGDGTRRKYTYDSTLGKYLNKDGEGAHDTLSYSSSTSKWTWTDGDSRVAETYDWVSGSGKLLEVADPSGNKLTYTYTGNLLTLVTNASGEKTYLDYSGTNLTQVRVVKSDASTSTAVRYGYDASNRLTSVTVDLSPDDNSIADGKTYTTTYTYDGTSKRVAGITQSDGTSLAIAYTQVGGAYCVSSVTDALGRVTQYSYTGLGTSAAQTTQTDALGKVTTITSDAAGRLTQVVTPAATTQFAYDTSGNLVSQTDGLGRVTVYEYDANGNQTLARDALGNTVVRQYDSSNQLLNETAYVVPDPDGAGSGQPATPLTTRYAYDAQNNLRFEVSAAGRVTEYRYNASGQLTSALQYAGNTYDVSGLASTATLTETTLATWAAGAGIDRTRILRSDTSYDFCGQVSSVTTYAKTDNSGNGVADGSQATTNFVYDARGRLLQRVEPKGVATTGVANDFVTSFTYDGLGRLLTSTDTLGRVTTTQYDAANRKITVTQADGGVSTNVYDAAGQLLSTAHSDGSTTLSSAQYWYDADGRPCMTQDATGVRTFMLYDAAGRLVASIDGTGALVEYTYDAADQLVRSLSYATRLGAATLASLVNGGGNPTNPALSAVRPATTSADVSEWILYDAAGRAVKTVDGEGGVVQTFYDGAGRITDVVAYANTVSTSGITTATQATDAAVTPTANAGDRRVRSFQDAEGRQLATLDAAGYLTENEYDGAGRLVHTISYATQSASSQWTSGTLAQLRPATSTADQHSWVLYDGRGNVAAEVDPEGYLTEHVYDANGNETQRIAYATLALLAPQAITTATTVSALRPASSSQDQAGSWTYTDLDQVATRTDEQGTVTRFTYDEMGRVVKAETAYGTSQLRTLQTRYDKLGRITAELSAEGSAALAALNSPTQAQIDALWAQYGIRYTYDSASRRTSSTDATGKKTLFYYDANGQLSFSINALGEVVESRYDALGNLTSTVAYAARIGGSTLASLVGGLADSAVTAAVNAIADGVKDSVQAVAYDRRGLAISHTDALLFTDTSTYNAFGELVSSTNRIDASTTVTSTVTYDTRGSATITVEDSGGLARSTSAVYDAFGRTIQATDANGKTRSTQYDRRGRVVQTTDALGSNRSSTYDAFDRVLTQTDALGNTTSYAYDSSARSMTVTTPEGMVVTTSMNRHGQVVSVTDGLGNTSTRSYDANGNVTADTDALGHADTSTYDTAGRLLQVTDATGVVTCLTYDAAGRVLTRAVDPSGLNIVTSTEYDGMGRAVKMTDPTGVVTQTTYDRQGQVTQVAVDPTGANLRTTYTYDAQGKTLTVTAGAGTSAATTVQYTYDKLGRRTQEAVDPSGLNLVTQYQFAANGNVVKRTDADGVVTRYAYDAENQLVFTLNALGGVTRADYDAEGRLVKATAYANAVSGLSSYGVADIAAAITADSARDKVDRSVFDKDGRLVYGIDSLGGVVKNEYDAAGRVVKTTAYATPITVPATPTPASVAAAVTADAARDRVVCNVYDAAGELVYGIDALGQVTKNVYDAAGRVVASIAYANAITLPASPTVANVAAAVTANASNDRRTRHVYDTAGREIYTVDALGFVLATQYDAAGRVTLSRQFKYYVGSGQSVAGDALTAAAVEAVLSPIQADRGVASVYDSAGRLAYSVDPEMYVSTYAYDGAGRLTGATRYADRLTGGATMAPQAFTLSSLQALLPATVPATAVTTQRAYDAAGRLLSTTDGEGIVTRNELDALGQVTKVTVGYGRTDAASTSFSYDALGRVTQSVAGSGSLNLTTRFQYDTFGQRTAVIDARGVEASEQNTDWAKAERKLVGYVDGSGNALLASALSTAQKQALLDRYTSRCSYDVLGRKSQDTDALGNATLYGYNRFGEVVKLTDPRGYSAYFYFDKLGRQTLQVDPLGYGVASTYNFANERVSQTRYANAATGSWSETAAPTFTGDAAKDSTTSCVYDLLGRKTSETDAAGATESWTYNGLGDVVNHTNALGGTTTFSYDRRGLVTSEVLPVTAPNMGGIESNVSNSYQYDSRGNRTLVLEGYGMLGERRTTYTYDKADRLIAKTGTALTVLDTSFNTTTGTPTETYTYDARGNRLMVDTNGRKTYAWYDAANRKIATADATGAFTRWTLDAAGNTIRQDAYGDTVTPTTASVPTPVNAANVRTSYSAFDANNRVVKVWRMADNVYDHVNGLRSNVEVATVNTYDANGNLVRVVDANGNSTWRYYDKLGQLSMQVDAAGYGASWTYDALGNALSERSYGSALSAATLATLNASSDTAALASAFLAGASAANDRLTLNSYDRMGRVVRKAVQNVDYASVNGTTGALTQANGDAVTTFAYNGLGLVTSTTNAEGATTVTGYDAIGRVTSKKLPAFSGELAAAGTANLHAVTLYTYDGVGNLIGTEDKAYSDASASYVGASRKTNYTYNSAGWKTGEIDAAGNNTVYEYDVYGQMVRQTEPRAESIADAAPDVDWNNSPVWWVPVSAGSSTLKPILNPLLSSLADQQKPILGQFNSDGRTDVLWYDPVTGNNRLYLDNGDGSFALTTNPITPTEINGGNGLTAGDFNGDGKLDLLWWDATSGTTRWYINNGSGSFTKTENPAALGGSNSIAGYDVMRTGDFNGDGKTDVLWIKASTGSNRLVSRAADGTFTCGVNPLSTSAVGGSGVIYVADFNGDGKSDVLWYAMGTGNNIFLINNGSGTAFTQVTNPIATGNLNASSGALYVADFNGDGKADLFLRGATTARMFINNGAGTAFTIYNDPIASSNLSSTTALYVADFNGDGKADIVLANPTAAPVYPGQASVVRWFQSAGTSFSSVVNPLDNPANKASAGRDAATRMNEYAAGTGLALHFGNADGKALLTRDTAGKYDIATTDWNDDPVWWVPKSGGGVQPILNPLLAAQGGQQQPILADFNGDGRKDVLWYDKTSGANRLYLDNGDGTFTARQRGIDSWRVAGGEGLTAGDFNGDGKMDLLWWDKATGATRWYINDGNGYFTETENPTALGGTNAVTGFDGLLLGDFNGDGKTDVLWYKSATGLTRIVSRNSDGSFSCTVNPITPASIDGTGQLFVADFNGDGKTDVLWYQMGSGTNRMFINNGSGTAFTYTSNPIAAGSITASSGGLYAADFNGDGKADLMLRGASGTTRMFINNGAGIAFTIYDAPIATSNFSANTAMYVADFNGDGKADIVLADPDTTPAFNGQAGTVRWFQSAGTSFASVANPLDNAINKGGARNVKETMADYAAGTRQGLHYGNKNGDGLIVVDSTRYAYDAAGRATSELDWSSGDTRTTRYNAWGDIVANGMSRVSGGFAQADHETAEYDALGHLWRGNSGDGVMRAHLYDANGNATLRIESAGANLKNMTLAQMMASTDTRATINVYDQRNQLVQAIEPKVQSDAVTSLSGVLASNSTTLKLPSQPINVGGVAMNFRPVNPDWKTAPVWYLQGNRVVANPLASAGNGLTTLVGRWASSGTDVLYYDKASGSASLLIDGGAGTYSSRPLGIPPLEINGGQGLTAGDFNGDGKLDLLWWDKTSGTTRWYINNGSGSFTKTENPAALGGANAVTGFDGLLLGDFNGDGKTDVLWYKSSTGLTRIVSRNADGSFSCTVNPITPASIDGTGQLFVADFNGDGKSDILWYQMSSGTNRMFINNGSGTAFTYSSNPIATGSINASSGALYVADFTGDGKADLFLRAATTTRMFVNNGAGTAFTVYDAPIAYSNFGSNTAVYVDEYSGAGGSDLLLYDTVSGASSWFSGGNGTFTTLTNPVSANSQNTAAPIGSAWVSINMLPGSTDSGWTLNTQKLNNGTYEFSYSVTDPATGTVLNADSGQFQISAGSLSVLSQANWLAAPTTPGLSLQTVLQQSRAGQLLQGVTQRQYNAFGEVIAEIDALGHRADLGYNTMGKLLVRIDPQTSATQDNGTVQSLRPQTRYYYDRAGSAIGMMDANSHITTQKVIYAFADDEGQLQPSVVKEFHADGGTRAYAYDAFGNRAQMQDELGLVTRYGYDTDDNLVLVDRQAVDRHFDSATQSWVLLGFTVDEDERYGYDYNGNRLYQTDVLGNTAKWRYDSQGRVVQSVSAAGRIATTNYYLVDDTWNAAATHNALSPTTANALQTRWGTLSITTDGNGRALWQLNDVYQRLRWKEDLGAKRTYYTYNQAGWVLGQTSDRGQNLSYDYAYNGDVRSITDTAVGTVSRFAYDLAGNRVFESYRDTSSANGHYQYARIEYDELNRVKRSWGPQMRIDYEYDAVGNRRRIHADYRDGITNALAVQDYWYLYDSMDRFTVTKGSLVNGSIQKGSTGVDLSYNAAGERTRAVYGGTGAHTEDYVMVGHQLITAKIDGVVRAERIYDRAGRQVTYKEYNADANHTVRTNETTTYDADGLTTKVNDNLTNNGTNYTYLNDGTLDKTVTYGSSTTVTTTYAYDWWDAAKQTEIKIKASNQSAPGWKPGFSKFTYDVNGNVLQVQDVAGNRTLNYLNDGEGHVLRRQEFSGTTLTKTHEFYFVNGQQVGDVGNDGQSELDYAQDLARNKKLTQEQIRKRFKPSSVADFDPSYDPINSGFGAGAGADYEVKAGDTLQSIALAIWGDAGLWYLIADANGLNASATLTAGTTLVIPNQVTGMHNNASTFQVYDPMQALGDVSPTLPKAPAPKPKKSSKKKGGCGKILLGILIAAVAVVAMIYVAPIVAPIIAPVMGAVFGAGTAVAATATALGTIAVTAAVGSAVGQGLSIAAGLQQKFSWAQVGISAATAVLTAGISAGADALSSAAAKLGKFAGIARAGLGVASQTASAAVQQLGNKILNPQQRYNWGAVLRAGLMAAGKIGLSAAARGASWLGSKAGDLVGRVRSSFSQTASHSAMLSSNASGFAPDGLGAAADNLIAANPAGPNDDQTDVPQLLEGHPVSALKDGVMMQEDGTPILPGQEYIPPSLLQYSNPSGDSGRTLNAEVKFKQAFSEVGEAAYTLSGNLWEGGPLATPKSNIFLDIARWAQVSRSATAPFFSDGKNSSATATEAARRFFGDEFSTYSGINVDKTLESGPQGHWGSALAKPIIDRFPKTKLKPAHFDPAFWVTRELAEGELLGKDWYAKTRLENGSPFYIESREEFNALREGKLRYLGVPEVNSDTARKLWDEAKTLRQTLDEGTQATGQNFKVVGQGGLRSRTTDLLKRSAADHPVPAGLKALQGGGYLIGLFAAIGHDLLSVGHRAKDGHIITPNEGAAKAVHTGLKTVVGWELDRLGTSAFHVGVHNFNPKWARKFADFAYGSLDPTPFRQIERQWGSLVGGVQRGSALLVRKSVPKLVRAISANGGVIVRGIVGGIAKGAVLYLLQEAGMYVLKRADDAIGGPAQSILKKIGNWFDSAVFAVHRSLVTRAAVRSAYDLSAPGRIGGPNGWVKDAVQSLYDDPLTRLGVSGGILFNDVVRASIYPKQTHPIPIIPSGDVRYLK